MLCFKSFFNYGALLVCVPFDHIFWKELERAILANNTGFRTKAIITFLETLTLSSQPIALPISVTNLPIFAMSSVDLLSNNSDQLENGLRAAKKIQQTDYHPQVYGWWLIH